MFKSLEIKKIALDRLTGDQGELFKSDVEGSLKSLPPGEWVLLRDPHRKRVYLGFANPLVADKHPAIHVLHRLAKPPKGDEVETYLERRLDQAFRRREVFEGYGDGARLVFGAADGLPGLVVDGYANGVLVQVNTAGMERWRTFFRERLEERTGKRVYFLDQPAQRAREMLPHHAAGEVIPELDVRENGFRYSIPRRHLQKVGWYYDHRENRRKLEAAVARWRGSRARGLDLFCYGGAWGLHVLRAGVGKVDFVDQAPLVDVVCGHLEANGYAGRGEFHHGDVFAWMEAANGRGEKWDVVVSDPPAFAKSSKDIPGALEGYRRLHRAALKAAADEALFVAASCTKYVDMNSFIATVTHAARAEGRKVRLLDVGIQGWDHPVADLVDRGNYIKYTLWGVENI